MQATGGVLSPLRAPLRRPGNAAGRAGAGRDSSMRADGLSRMLNPRLAQDMLSASSDEPPRRWRAGPCNKFTVAVSVLGTSGRTGRLPVLRDPGRVGRRPPGVNSKTTPRAVQPQAAAHAPYKRRRRRAPIGVSPGGRLGRSQRKIVLGPELSRGRRQSDHRVESGFITRGRIGSLPDPKSKEICGFSMQIPISRNARLK